jgi:hypothetical protein
LSPIGHVTPINQIGAAITQVTPTTFTFTNDITTPPDPMREGPLKDVVPTLGLDDPELTWHDGLDVPIDPFGLENEFKEKGPILKPTATDQQDAQIHQDQLRTKSRTER